ncbi:MAG: hypothetical protein ACYTGH_22030, partial [Planctomycetota bacterium]
MRIEQRFALPENAERQRVRACRIDVPPGMKNHAVVTLHHTYSLAGKMMMQKSLSIIDLKAGKEAWRLELPVESDYQKMMRYQIWNQSLILYPGRKESSQTTSLLQGRGRFLDLATGRSVPHRFQASPWQRYCEIVSTMNRPDRGYAYVPGRLNEGEVYQISVAENGASVWGALVDVPMMVPSSPIYGPTSSPHWLMCYPVEDRRDRTTAPKDYLVWDHQKASYRVARVAGIPRAALTDIVGGPRFGASDRLLIEAIEVSGNLMWFQIRNRQKVYSLEGKLLNALESRGTVRGPYLGKDSM